MDLGVPCHVLAEKGSQRELAAGQALVLRGILALRDHQIRVRRRLARLLDRETGAAGMRVSTQRDALRYTRKDFVPLSVTATTRPFAFVS